MRKMNPHFYFGKSSNWLVALVGAMASLTSLPASAEAAGPALTLGGKDVPLYSRGSGVKTISPIVAKAPDGAVLDGILTRADDGLEVAAQKPLSGNSLRFDVKEVGYYTLVARLVGADGEILASATNGYAVTPPASLAYATISRTADGRSTTTIRTRSGSTSPSEAESTAGPRRRRRMEYGLIQATRRWFMNGIPPGASLVRA